jgi:hypothetical protein
MFKRASSFMDSFRGRRPQRQSRQTPSTSRQTPSTSRQPSPTRITEQQQPVLAQPGTNKPVQLYGGVIYDDCALSEYMSQEVATQDMFDENILVLSSYESSWRDDPLNAMIKQRDSEENVERQALKTARKEGSKQERLGVSRHCYDRPHGIWR